MIPSMIPSNVPHRGATSPLREASRLFGGVKTKTPRTQAPSWPRLNVPRQRHHPALQGSSSMQLPASRSESRLLCRSCRRVTIDTQSTDSICALLLASQRPTRELTGDEPYNKADHGCQDMCAVNVCFEARQPPRVRQSVSSYLRRRATLAGLATTPLPKILN